MNKEKILLSLIIGLFILIRSVNFTSHLNFSYDQAWFSTRVLEIWRNKEFTLVGPGSSLVVDGKQVLYGSINYYFQLIFQLLGNFDPVSSAYAFMLFAALMTVPLYYGVKMLSDSRVAILTTSLYALAPTYIDFTRFFFAPNFQISLLPLVFFCMGLYKKTMNGLFFFLTFFLVGVLFQFHFAVLLIFILLLFYYFKEKPYRNFNKVLYAFSGFFLGLLPLALFELKNNFYNIRVFREYLQIAGSVSNFEPLPHRYLVLSFVVITLVLIKYKRFITNRVIFVSCLLLLVFDLFLYFPVPQNGFGMAKNWNYLMEKKAYEIIRNENIRDFNIANLIYDNKSVVIKYLFKKDQENTNFDDYYNNKYLFVIAESEKQVSDNPAYEVHTFLPRKKLRQWKLNNYYNLYLFERKK